MHSCVAHHLACKWCRQRVSTLLFLLIWKEFFKFGITHIVLLPEVRLDFEELRKSSLTRLLRAFHWESLRGSSNNKR